MKSKLLILMLATLIMASAARAQEFSIRANRGLNLRAAPSLNADLAGAVVSGEILQVLGASGEWLKISRNGRHV